MVIQSLFFNLHNHSIVSVFSSHTHTHQKGQEIGTRPASSGQNSCSTSKGHNSVCSFVYQTVSCYTTLSVIKQCDWMTYWRKTGHWHGHASMLLPASPPVSQHHLSPIDEALSTRRFTLGGSDHASPWASGTMAGFAAELGSSQRKLASLLAWLGSTR